MFQYNKFWHFWYRLDNRNYLTATWAATGSVVLPMLAFFVAASFFPVLATLPAVGFLLFFIPPILIAGSIALFTALSNFFYKQQNQQLETTNQQLERLIDLEEAALKEKAQQHQNRSHTKLDKLKQYRLEINSYLNRRSICPQNLLENLSSKMEELRQLDSNAIDSSVIEFSTGSAFVGDALTLENDDNFSITKPPGAVANRNPNFKATGQFNELFIKEAAANDALSEIAAREMAEIMGYNDLIPSNTVADTTHTPTVANTFHNYQNGRNLSNESLILSKQRIKEFIDQTNQENPDNKVKNSVNVQNIVAKFVFNSKAALYRNKAQRDENFKLLYIQRMLPNALSGIDWFIKLFNEPVGFSFMGGLTREEIDRQRQVAKELVRNIDLPCFQENFLLHLLLGSQDVNPGNTLFIDGPANSKLLRSIDHERIMPEDNYNVTKKIPVNTGNGAVERDVTNVFPLRLWLAGLPQANVPFTREVINKALASLNPQHLLAYHNRKKLFSSAAVGAQIERLLLIKELFAEEAKKAIITLTPRQLFLNFVNNHPTYDFLKNQLQLSDLSVFMLLGNVPEDADFSLWRHPLKFFPMLEIATELPSLSQEQSNSPHFHNLLFFHAASQQKEIEKLNAPGLEILAEVSTVLTR